MSGLNQPQNGESKMLLKGELAPEIVLPDSAGAPWRLSDQVASGPAVLLFYRGYW
jgi:peroxiredoxin